MRPPPPSIRDGEGVEPSHHSWLSRQAGALAEELLAHEMPTLSTEERAAAGRLVTRAVSQLPDSLRGGVWMAGVGVRVSRGLVGHRWSEARVPVVQEYARMVRGLALAAACEVSDLRGARTP